jgi:predicted nicotinamide N-methyase
VARPSPADLRAFVRRHTRLKLVPGVSGVRLHQADDVTAVWNAVGRELARSDPPLPFWAFAWSGGLAIAHYLLDHPDVVEGRSVLDIGTGSGLCAIVAASLGATDVRAADIEPLSAAAVAINARANGIRVGFSGRDMLAEPPSSVDVVLAGDICYEETMTRRMLDWLSRAAAGGARVFVGDPGRTYLPPGLERVASYRVHTSREIEDSERKIAAVYSLAGVQVTTPTPSGS